MAKSDIGVEVGIDGEKEFKKQISSMNEGLKTLASEMEVVTSRYGKNEESVESLSAQNDVLERTILSLNEKLNAQKDRLNDVAQAYGEADSRTQKMQQSVNKTEAALNKAQNAYDDNSKKIEEMGDAGENTGKGLGDIFSSVSGILTDKLGKSLGTSSEALGSLTSALSGASGALSGLGASASGVVASIGAIAVPILAIVEATKKLVEYSVEASKAADEINTLATKYGMSTRAIQQFRYMADLTDTSVETVTGSMSHLVRSMDSARSGSGSASEAFKALGVQVTNENGTLRSSNEVFAEVLDKLGKIPDQTERDAKAMAIFGKGAQDLNGLIATGAEGLKEYAKEADASGYVMSEYMLKSLQDVDDAGQKLDKSMDSLKNTLGVVLAPVVADVKEGLADMIGKLSYGIQELFNWNEQTDAAADAANGATEAFGSCTDAINDEADAARNALADLKSLADRHNAVVKQIEESGLGRQLSVYDPNTGVTYSTLASMEDAQSYRRGEASVMGLYGESYADTSGRLQNGQNINITLKVGDREFGSAVYEYNNAETRRIGNHAIR